MSAGMAGTSAVSRTGSGVLDYNKEYTKLGWLYVNAATGQDLMALNGSTTGGVNDNVDGLWFSGTKIEVDRKVGGSSIISVNGALTVVAATWHCYALCGTPGGLTLYLGTTPGNMAQDANPSGSIGARGAVAGDYLGGWTSTAATNLTGRFALDRQYQRRLSLAQIQLEVASVDPVSLVGLVCNRRLLRLDDLGDTSGNGYTGTAIGTLTTQADPTAMGFLAASRAPMPGPYSGYVDLQQRR